MSNGTFPTYTMIQPFIRRILFPAALAFGILTLQGAPALAASAPRFLAGTQTSGNWAGYVATAGTYTGAGATWTIPTATPAAAAQSGDATWVGIGGMGTSDLIQAGTIALTQNGSTVYQAWYELLPAFSTPIPVTVRPGDSVTASVALQSGTGQWLISFKNNATGAAYQTTVAYASTQASAEWIQEMATSTQGSYIPLDNFGTTTFTNAWTIKNGQALDVAQSGATPIQMTTAAGQLLAQTASVSADGTGFSVSRTAANAIATTIPGAQSFVTVSTIPTVTWTYSSTAPQATITATSTPYPQRQFQRIFRRRMLQAGAPAISYGAILMRG